MEHKESICPHCTDGHSIYIYVYSVLNLQLKHLKSEVCLVWPLYSYQMWRYNHTAIYAQEGFQLCGTNWISSASQKISFITCLVYDNWLIIGCIATQSNIRSPNTGAQIEMSGEKNHTYRIIASLSIFTMQYGSLLPVLQVKWTIKLLHTGKSSILLISWSHLIGFQNFNCMLIMMLLLSQISNNAYLNIHLWFTRINEKYFCLLIVLFYS